MLLQSKFANICRNRDDDFQRPNFQDLVAKVKNLGALAPVLGAISRPVLYNLRKRYSCFLMLLIQALNYIIFSLFNI